jgi:hypothetical protein
LVHRRPIIRSIDDAEEIRAGILSGAARSAEWLRGFVGEPIELLRALRYHTVGTDPLTGDPLNFVEQINQTFTILVSLRAVELLLKLHPQAEGFRLALATSSGRDIESIVPNLVAAEVFSATHPSSNQKLKKDIMRLSNDSALHRYVFFAAPGYQSGRHKKLETSQNVKVYCVEI